MSSLLMMAGCDWVFGLERSPDPLRFCDRVAQQDTVFCEDFDDLAVDDDEALAFRAFVRLDSSASNLSYEVEHPLAYSPPRAVRLGITGPGSPDARLSRQLIANDRLAVSFRMQLAVADSNVVVVTRIHLTGTRNLYLTSDGLIREVSTSREIAAQVNALPVGRWFEVVFELDLAGRSGMVVVDGEAQTLLLDKLTIPDDNRSVVLGPAEPDPDNTVAGWSILFDDIAVR